MRRRAWDCSDPLGQLTPAERILELEVRSGTTLDALQNLQTMKVDEWQTKARSAEYAKVKEKLAARKVGTAQAGR